jgi:hypothetical protein
VADRLPGLIVTEGIREIVETYKLFARSFSDEGPITGSRHVEFLIDKQGYVRSPLAAGGKRRVEESRPSIVAGRNITQ